jgi:S-adenosylmethionine:tRNA ribosyltransferase-isomerase
MRISDFDYVLPPELIANEPANPRDACRLMVINKSDINKKGVGFEHRVFNELPDLLREGDILVFNDSKVIPARINFLHNGKKVEIFLIKKIEKTMWLVIGKPGKLLKKDAKFEINKRLSSTVIQVNDDGQRLVEFSADGDFDEILKEAGSTPLPPYIKNSTASFEDYQTIYAKKQGSIAAPTAGLHFTEKLFEKLRNKGVGLEFVTLHVGLGTFLPVKTDNPEDHKMHSEYFSFDKETADRLNEAKKAGRRIIAVGTTSVRVLESSYDTKTGFKSGFGETAIFIYPGYEWKCVDGLITNFHLPKSTLLLLTCSFGGKDLILKAYSEAVKKKYRFYSFGDAMFIE